MPAQHVLYALVTSLLLALSPSAGAAEVPAAPAVDVPQLQAQAEAGDSAAQYRLGSLYEFGQQGLAQDNQLALGWLLKAAEQGYAPAQASVGALYLFELEGVTAGYGLARTWLQRAAEQNDPRAQYNLGVIYRDSLGVERDTLLAIEWFERAAEQGDVQAQYNLGVLYENPGIDQPDKAHKWYRLAAAQGFAAAQFNLGVLYFQGNGVTADPVLGYALLWLAEANAPVSDEDLPAPHEQAEETMQEQQVAAGEVLASQLQKNFSVTLERYLATTTAAQ